jgi:hypothetical protein
MVFNYYTKPFTDPKVWTAAREAMWARYVVSRLAAFDTVFLWNPTNEYEIYPAGKYAPGEPSDDEWARRMAGLFRAADPHRHPVTVHPMEDAFRTPAYSPSLNGDVGKRLGAAPEFNVLSHQHNAYQTAKWNGKLWEGSGAGIDQAIERDRKYGRPVLNTESGYEWIPDYPTSFNRQVHGTDKCRAAAWRILAAGGAGMAAGFTGTWHGRDNYTRINFTTRETEGPIPFRIEDSGLARQLGYLYDFTVRLTALGRMTPRRDLINAPNLCLAEPGAEYVVYAPESGNVELNLTRDAAALAGEWLNPRTGARQSLGAVKGGLTLRQECPGSGDWVLHLRAETKRTIR